MKKEKIITFAIVFLLLISFSYVIGSAVVRNNYLITGMATGIGGGDINTSELCGNDVCNHLNGENSDNCPEDCWCGDGVVDDVEECDNGNLDFKSCSSFGYDFGNLDCFNDCTFDTSDCSYQEDDEESTCGNGVCESFETCENCVTDCVWETADCGNNGICYLNKEFGRCMPICEYGQPSICGCGEQWIGQAPFGMILNELGPNPATGCNDENCRGERAYCFIFPEGADLPKPTSSNIFVNACDDGTKIGDCSLTRPMICDDRKNLIYDCSTCGCGVGYYCEDNGICLIEKKLSEENENAPLWRQLEGEYDLLRRSEKIKELVRRGVNEDVLLSNGAIITDIIKVENLKEKLEIPIEIMFSASNRIKKTGDILTSPEAEELEELLDISPEDIVGGRVLKGVIEGASYSKGEVPLFSAEDVVEVSCVDISGGSCLGESECCSGFICNAGICVENFEVESVNIPVEEILTESGYGLSNLVSVTGGSVESITEYETHPAFIEGLNIPDSVNFGFYDIKVSDENNAVLEFDVLNDLLVLNQIVAIGLYRLTPDGWESLDLVDINYDSERTTFKFETSGFSYFTLRGIKEGISFESVTSEDEGLWAVYRRSFTPGFALIEFFFGEEDTLIFGILNNKPLLDLGLSSGF
jgi:hypothetical protein